jgi:hypothetical protein
LDLISISFENEPGLENEPNKGNIAFCVLRERSLFKRGVE